VKRLKASGLKEEFDVCCPFSTAAIEALRDPDPQAVARAADSWDYLRQLAKIVGSS